MSSPLVPTGQLTRLRLVNEWAMLDSVVIERLTTESDGMGGQTTSWTTIATVNGRLTGRGNGTESLIAEQLADVSPWSLAVPLGTDLTANDQVTVNGRLFTVTAVVDSGRYLTAVRALLKEVQRGG